ncbi:MAG: glycosyltransferase [Clostridia bacterium]|nr:glycosyltransferase [Clostridia bacterium]
MKYSIAISIYNRLPLVKKCLRAVLASTGPDAEILLVNNHPPYPEVQRFLRSLKHPRVKVLDPGRNLGCHGGNNYALFRSRGRYLVKLDDDIIVPRNNWLAAMRRTLESFPPLACIAAPWQPEVLQDQPGQRVVTRPGIKVKLCYRPLIFGCVMFRREEWFKHFVFRDSRLYGYEEDWVFQQIKKMGRRQGYLISHRVLHLARRGEDDPLYGMWKVLYAFKFPDPLINSFPVWRKSFKPTTKMVSYLRNWGYRNLTLEKMQQLKAGSVKGGKTYV